MTLEVVGWSVWDAAWVLCLGEDELDRVGGADEFDEGAWPEAAPRLCDELDGARTSATATTAANTTTVTTVRRLPRLGWRGLPL